ncbi:MAG: MmgE/PrpD family protein [Desulfurococcaceae archaeon]|nr:MmgE/PrpD family protein [Desulfurococcaceae archaeon]
MKVSSNVFLTDVIGKYVEHLRYEDLPSQVVEKAKVHILDSVRCMLGASLTSLGRSIAENLSTWEHGSSTVVGYKRSSSLLTAVYVNSTFANLLDYDDTYIGHPGATIVPVALNIGELLHSPGKEAVTAVVLGYEAALRFGLGLRPSVERRYVHGHGSWQVFGACVAASKLLGLGADEVANALSIAAANAPVPSVMKTVYGLTGPTPCKNNFGTASVVGVLSAFLAKGGLRGPRDIFEGDTGFWRMIGTDRCELSREFEDLGRRYVIMNVAFKPYPCCRLIHSSIDAFLECVKHYSIEVDSIERVVVRAIPVLSKHPFTNSSPRDIFEAQFSIPYAIACAARNAEAVDVCSSEDSLKDSKISELSKRIFIESVPEFDEEFRKDPGRIPAEVVIYLRNKEYRCKVDVPRGDPRNPLPPEVLVSRFRAVALKVLKREGKVTALINSILELDRLSDVEDLTAMLIPD